MMRTVVDVVERTHLIASAREQVTAQPVTQSGDLLNVMNVICSTISLQRRCRAHLDWDRDTRGREEILLAGSQMMSGLILVACTFHWPGIPLDIAEEGGRSRDEEEGSCEEA